MVEGTHKLFIFSLKNEKKKTHTTTGKLSTHVLIASLKATVYFVQTVVLHDSLQGH